MASLTVPIVEDIIDKVVENQQDRKWHKDLRALGLRLRREASPGLPMANTGIATQSMSESTIMNLIPYFFRISVYSINENVSIRPCGTVTFYSAYSTWDGRCLFIDRFDLPQPAAPILEKLILRAMADIAVAMECARLCWKTSNIPKWYNEASIPPELLSEWLILCMNKDAMIHYTGLSSIVPANSVGLAEGPSVGDDTHGDMLMRANVESRVNKCLEEINQTSEEFTFRLANGEDVHRIMELVHGLAEFEKEPDGVNVSVENYIRDGMSSSEPLFYCLMIQDKKSIKNKESALYSCGMTFLYFGYELGKGRFLYLEDLFLEEAFRKRGGGSLAMKTLATLSLRLQCQNFYWVALDWNTPALNLYAKIGAKVQEGVVVARYTNDNLKAFAGGK